MDRVYPRCAGIDVQLMLVNAQHIRRVPGRKTDVTDSQCIWPAVEVSLLPRRSFGRQNSLRWG